MAFQIFFLVPVPLISDPSCSSTPPFSSEEELEGDTGHHHTPLPPPQTPARTVPKLEDSWDWSDTETSEENAQSPGKGSGGLASSGEWDPSGSPAPAQVSWDF